jgi:hypothetical protein
MKDLIELPSGSGIEPIAKSTELQCRIAKLELGLGGFPFDE